MARAIATSVENNFTGGFVTEHSNLNFPENACTQATNCVFDITGTVSRREGFDFEFGYSSKAIDRTSNVITGFLWQNVNGDGNTFLYVLQVGTKLYFYNVSQGTSTAVSSGALSPTIDLTAFSPSGAPSPANNECQFAAGDGYLFVTHPNLEPFSVSFDSNAVTFTTTQITIQIRDFDGIVEAGVGTATRPTSLTSAHNYNLLNQGWTDGSHGDVISSNLIDVWHTAESNYPSNSDIWWEFKNSSNVFDPTTTAASVNTGNTPAPSGHFILNAFNQNRTTASGITGFTAFTSAGQRPSAVAFFAGRVFYSGVNATGFGSNIYFSQIIELNAAPTAQFGKCYQSSDPTSQDSFDLLPSDGGVIKISDCGTVYKLFAIQGALIVFASNGIWTITGSTGLGFTAIDFSVNKLSSIRCISSSSFVDVLGFPMWWTGEGIYSIRVDASAGGLRIDSLTDMTIRSFYADIPLASKRTARGYYNPIEFEVQWLYTEAAPTTTQSAYQFDNVLSFNTILGAFSPWKITTGNVQVHGLTVVQTIGGNTAASNVVDNLSSLNPIVDNLTNLNPIVIYTLGISTSISYVFKYLCSYLSSGASQFTFAETRNTRYVDWFSFDSTGQAYSSSFTSGFKVHGQAQRKFQSNYLYVHMDNTTPTSVYVQGLWNTANPQTSSLGTTSGKLTSRQLISFDGEDFQYRYKRLKIRGEGLTLQFLFSSIVNQPFTITGWSILETGNNSP